VTAWTEYTEHAAALAAEGGRLRAELDQIQRAAVEQRQSIDAELQAVAARAADGVTLADRLDADAVALAERVDAVQTLSLGRRTGGPPITDTALLDTADAHLRTALQAFRTEVEAEQARRAPAATATSIHLYVRIAIGVVLALVLLQLIVSSLT
jgi:hypothetical protein